MIENSKKKDKIVLTILIGLLLVSVVFNFYLYNSFSRNSNQELEVEEEKALLDVQMYQWAKNLYDSSEMFFEYWVYNYGNAEARNIKVRCDLIEEDLETRRVSVLDYYGNLASSSAGFGEITTDMPPISAGEEFIGLCHVESCDNCEILYKRIPDLIESYE